jgi:uncharacterized integral membrane protein (TIGR00698 family)
MFFYDSTDRSETMTEQIKLKLSKSAIIILFTLTALPFVAPPIALITGTIFTLLFGNPLPQLTSKASKIFLKVAVIGLGFGVNFVEVIEVGKSSLLLTFISISTTILLGTIIGKALRVPVNTRSLISFGTAICGGSAIAAMAPVIKAKDEEIAVSLATIFSLNAVALIIFPPLGHYFGLNQHQFGIWAALAIHDTSSVVGATSAFGAVALTVGTTAKLTRALWIVPCSLVAGIYHKSDKRADVPLFIIGFIAAAMISSWLPRFDLVWDSLYTIARQILVMTLFLIGTGLTRQTLQQTGPKPLLLAIVLWCCVSSGTLFFLLHGIIG